MDCIPEKKNNLAILVKCKPSLCQKENMAAWKVNVNLSDIKRHGVWEERSRNPDVLGSDLVTSGGHILGGARVTWKASRKGQMGSQKALSSYHLETG